VLRDGLVASKTGEALRAVLAPKVAGSVWLLEASRNLAPGFLALFSSIAAVFRRCSQLCRLHYQNVAATVPLSSLSGFVTPVKQNGIVAIGRPLAQAAWRLSSCGCRPAADGTRRQAVGFAVPAAGVWPWW
jgi:hypothetical protein